MNSKTHHTQQDLRETNCPEHLAVMSFTRLTPEAHFDIRLTDI